MSCGRVAGPTPVKAVIGRKVTRSVRAAPLILKGCGGTVVALSRWQIERNAPRVGDGDPSVSTVTPSWTSPSILS